jgi:hypothetical protein
MDEPPLGEDRLLEENGRFSHKIYWMHSQTRRLILEKLEGYSM